MVAIFVFIFFPISSVNASEALFDAIQDGNEKLVTNLLKEGARANESTYVDGSEMHPLDAAAINCRLRIASILIKAGADPNANGYGGGTPLTNAAGVGCNSVVKLLLQHGAKPNQLDGSKETPLESAVNRDHCYPEIIETLLSFGGDANKALELGIYWNQPKVVTSAIIHGADKNQPTSFGELPLQLALRMSGPDIIRIVKESKAELLRKNSESEKWQRAGFDASSMRQWKKCGFTLAKASEWGKGTQPDEVVRWEKEGWSVADGKLWQQQTQSLDTAIWWKRLGFSPAEYKSWVSNAIGDADVAKTWKGAGYSPDIAARWIKSHIARPDDAHALASRCPNEVEPADALYQANPYDTKGRCFWFSGNFLQLLSKSTGIYTLAHRQFLVDFGIQSAPPQMDDDVVALGLGEYQYTDVTGAPQIIPSLQVVLSSKTNENGAQQVAP